MGYMLSSKTLTWIRKAIHHVFVRAVAQNRIVLHAIFLAKAEHWFHSVVYNR